MQMDPEPTKIDDISTLPNTHQNTSKPVATSRLNSPESERKCKRRICGRWLCAGRVIRNGVKFRRISLDPSFEGLLASERAGNFY